MQTYADVLSETGGTLPVGVCCGVLTGEPQFDDISSSVSPSDPLDSHFVRCVWYRKPL